MIDHQLNDRMISRARNLTTPLARLHDLAPRLLRLVPTSIGEAAERLGATRAEIEDVAAFTEDHVAHRECLVRRNADLRRADARDPFHTAGAHYVR